MFFIHLPILAMGFVAWWITGFYDDFIILVSLLKERRRKEVLLIFGGQMIGVILVAALSYFLAGQFEPNQYTQLVSGTILIVIGALLLVSSNKSTPAKSTRYLLIVAFMAYILNAFDDFSVLSASLLHFKFPQTIFFVCGFVIGWMTSFILAYHSLRLKWIKTWARYAPGILIIGGVYILISALI